MEKLNWTPTGLNWTPAVRAPFDWCPPRLEPDRVELSQPERLGLAESSEGSKLTGGGLSLPAGAPVEPWVAPVVALMEALKEGRWARALRMLGADERYLGSSVRLLRRMNVRLVSYSLSQELQSLELARVSVEEETTAAGIRRLRSAHFVVLRKGSSWAIAGLDGDGCPRRTELARRGQWSLLAGRPAERLMDHGLSALCWWLRDLWSDPRATFLGWAPRVPGIPLGLLGQAPSRPCSASLCRTLAGSSPSRDWSHWV